MIAVEVERELAEQLRERFVDDDSITVINADALALDIAELGVSDYHVVANLPFSVGTRLLVESAGIAGPSAEASRCCCNATWSSAPARPRGACGC